MKKHILDKPFLRDIFWFIVLPYRAKQFAHAMKQEPVKLPSCYGDDDCSSEFLARCEFAESCGVDKKRVIYGLTNAQIVEFHKKKAGAT